MRYFMGMSNISWGAVLVGAAAAVALIAIAPQTIGITLAAVSANPAAYYSAAGIIGGIAGEFVSDLLGKTGNAITTVAGR
jgi:hypothetical protein